MAPNIYCCGAGTAADTEAVTVALVLEEKWFSQWGDGTVMNSMNGSTMALSSAIDLPPGYHQYKFLVDGTWQVDEEQLRVIGEHGVINNLIFVEEPSANAQRLPPEAVREDLLLRTEENHRFAGDDRRLPSGSPLDLSLRLATAAAVDRTEEDGGEGDTVDILRHSRTEEDLPLDSTASWFGREKRKEERRHRRARRRRTMSLGAPHAPIGRRWRGRTRHCSAPFCSSQKGGKTTAVA
nr:sucrose nonfermenting 4-like protein isoform X2 [Ipomoea trifida]